MATNKSGADLNDWPIAGRDGVPEAFIQWKGTSVCMDLKCLGCGGGLHIDGDFAYHVECLGCGAVMQMRALVEYRAVEVDPELVASLGAYPGR